MAAQQEIDRLYRKYRRKASSPLYEGAAHATLMNICFDLMMVASSDVVHDELCKTVDEGRMTDDEERIVEAERKELISQEYI